MKTAVLSFQFNADIMGAKNLHAYILDNGFDNYLVLQPHKDPQTDEALLDFIDDQKIAVVGISVMSIDFLRSNLFAEKFKERFKDIPLVYGGIHATISPSDCLEFGDVAIRGEGEFPFLELLQQVEQNKDYGHIKGVCVKENGKVKINPPAQLPQDLDSLPFPRHLPDSMFVVHKGLMRSMNEKLFRRYARFNGDYFNLMATRGCPYSCTYCCNSVYRGMYDKYNVRKRSVDSIMAEIKEGLAQFPDLLSVNIQDDCFLINREEWIAEFADRYKREVRRPFVVRSIPRYLNKTKVDTLAEAGLGWIIIGLQTGSEEVNHKIYQRPSTNQQFLNAVRFVHKAGVSGLYDVILDNPYETEEDVLKTIDVLLKIPKPYQLEVFSLMMYPGAEITKRAIKDNLDFIDYRDKRDRQISMNVLNELIQMVPTFPAALIRYCVTHRKRKTTIIIVKICNTFNRNVLEPVSYIRLSYQATNYKLGFLIKQLTSAFKTVMLRFREV